MVTFNSCNDFSGLSRTSIFIFFFPTKLFYNLLTLDSQLFRITISQSIFFFFGIHSLKFSLFRSTFLHFPHMTITNSCFLWKFLHFFFHTPTSNASVSPFCVSLTSFSHLSSDNSNAFSQVQSRSFSRVGTSPKTLIHSSFSKS